MGGRGSSGSRNPVKKSTISDAERTEMLEHYVAGEGFEMNNYVRGLAVDEFEYSKADIAKFADKFTQVLDNESLPQAMEVYRGASFDSIIESTGMTQKQILANPSALVGKIVTERGFMSTTRTEAYAREYAQGRVLWDIKLPKGAKAVDQNSVLRYLDGDEITVQRNAQMKIDGVKRVNGVLMVQAHYTGIKRR